jgi:hypothetical protein
VTVAIPLSISYRVWVSSITPSLCSPIPKIPLPSPFTKGEDTDPLIYPSFIKRGEGRFFFFTMIQKSGVKDAPGHDSAT